MSLLEWIIAALIAVESGGDWRHPGDQGRAVGILQIHAEVIEDANRFAGGTWTLEDREDPRESVRIAIAYLGGWVSYHERREGRSLTPVEIARMWNGGGPSGHRKASTEEYGRRFREVWDAMPR